MIVLLLRDLCVDGITMKWGEDANVCVIGNITIKVLIMQLYNTTYNGATSSKEQQNMMTFQVQIGET